MELPLEGLLVAVTLVAAAVGYLAVSQRVCRRRLNLHRRVLGTDLLTRLEQESGDSLAKSLPDAVRDLLERRDALQSELAKLMRTCQQAQSDADAARRDLDRDRTERSAVQRELAALERAIMSRHHELASDDLRRIAEDPTLARLRQQEVEDKDRNR